MKKNPGFALIFSGTLFVRIRGPLRIWILPDLNPGTSGKENLKPRDEIELYMSGGSLLYWALTRVPPRLTGIVISSTFGRFGNQLIQVCTAIGLATEIGVGEVHLPKPAITEFKDRDKILGVSLRVPKRPSETRLLDKVIACARSLRQNESVLVGRFFELRTLPEIGTRVQTYRPEILRQIGLRVYSSSQIQALEQFHLVIHLRGGDVFALDSPPKKYGQPPIGFYEIAIEMENPARVTIVSEDQSNPTLPGILGFCASRGTSAEVQTGNFDEDLQTLLSARVICSSRGTFVEQVAGLSHNLRKIYLFGSDRFLREDLEVVRIIDSKGDFWNQVCDNNWRNTIPQRLMMESYHAKNLKVRT